MFNYFYISFFPRKTPKPKIMKKLLVLFLFAGLTFGATSCKKDDSCPEPEKPWAPGTWNATKYVESGQEQDANNPAVACILTHQMIFNEEGNGNWNYHYYDNNSSSCETIPLTLDSWAENKDKKILFIHFTYNGRDYDFSFTYMDETHFRWIANSNTYLEFTKQED